MRISPPCNATSTATSRSSAAGNPQPHPPPTPPLFPHTRIEQTFGFIKSRFPRIGALRCRDAAHDVKIVECVFRLWNWSCRHESIFSDAGPPYDPLVQPPDMAYARPTGYRRCDLAAWRDAIAANLPLL